MLACITLIQVLLSAHITDYVLWCCAWGKRSGLTLLCAALLSILLHDLVFWCSCAPSAVLLAWLIANKQLFEMNTGNCLQSCEAPLIVQCDTVREHVIFQNIKYCVKTLNHCYMYCIYVLSVISFKTSIVISIENNGTCLVKVESFVTRLYYHKNVFHAAKERESVPSYIYSNMNM